MTTWCLVTEGEPEVTRLSRVQDVPDGAGTLKVGNGGFKKTCQQLYEIRAGIGSPEELALAVKEKGFCPRCGAFEGHKTFCRVPEEAKVEAEAAEKAA